MQQAEIKDSDVVFVGYGINAPERAGMIMPEKLDVKGKTVVIVNDPDWQTPETEGEFNGRAMTLC